MSQVLGLDATKDLLDGIGFVMHGHDDAEFHGGNYMRFEQDFGL